MLNRPQFAKQPQGDRARIIKHVEDTVAASRAAASFAQGPDYADYCTANLHADISPPAPDNPSGARFKYVPVKGTFTGRVVVGAMGSATQSVTIALTPQGYMFNAPYNAFFGSIGDRTRALGNLGAWLEGAPPCQRANPALEFSTAPAMAPGKLPTESGMDYAMAFSGGKAQLHVSVPGDGAALVSVYDPHQTKAYGLSAGYETMLRQNPNVSQIASSFGMNPPNYPFIALDNDFTYALPEVFTLVGTSSTSSFTSASVITPNSECFTFSNPRYSAGSGIITTRVDEYEDRCGNTTQSELVGSGMWIVQNSGPSPITVTISGTYMYNARVSVQSGLIYDMGQYSAKHSNDRRMVTKFVNEYGSTGANAGRIMLDPNAITQRAGMAADFKQPPKGIPRDLHKSFLEAAKTGLHSFSKNGPNVPVVSEFANAADSVIQKGWGGLSDMFSHGKKGLSQLASAVNLIEEIGGFL